MTTNKKRIPNLYVSMAWFVVIFAICCNVHGSSSATDQEGLPATLKAAMKTAAIIDRAVAVYGGKEYLDSINDVNLVLNGRAFSTSRSHSPDEPRTLNANRTVAFQKKQENYRVGGEIHDGDYASTISSSASFWANVITPDEVHLIFPLMKMATRGFALPGIEKFGGSYVPQMVVADLLKNRKKLTWLGQETVAGEVHDLIAFPEGSLGGYTVFAFGKNSGAMTAMKRLGRDPVVGDVVNQARLGGYYKKGGTLYPKTRTELSGDRVTIRYNFETFDLDAKLNADVFAPPENFQVFFNPPNPARKITEIADKVYLITSGSNILVVEFDDYLIVVNASSFDFDAHLELIRETIGDKPIRYFVPLDHHGSRAVRNFIDAGVAIVTPGGNLDYYTKLSQAHPVVNPDNLARQPREPVFEIVDERREFDDGNVRLVLVNVGPIAHARDIFVAYLPELKMAFTTDMFNFNPDALAIAVAEEHMGLLEENLRALKGADFEVETVIPDRGWREPLPMREIENLIDGGTAVP